ncbi:MAG TPA: HAMP domain-containing sensor histidine kinase [Candidatus Saccharimonadales bacterium]|nr:HAMP domain-containing sensor histidine kinase [Candidatus Saccharimonadales bacterium]
MAVKQTPPQLVKNYWPRYRRQAIAITILMQIAATLAIGCALLATGATQPTVPFWIMLLAVIFTSIGVNILLVNQLLTPLKDLTSALTHISGEPSTITPPNPNASHFERDGFKPLLQLIYELAADKKTETEQKESQAETASKEQSVSEIATAFENTAAGFIIMKASGDILYANKNAPVHTDHENTKKIDLIFDDSPSLTEWLKDCEEHAVHAEQTWERVPSQIIGEEDRKIYDLVASYDKGSSAEVVITLFDRTADYQPEDDSLDFIAFAAHELRGPITVIRGYLDVLEDELTDKIDAEQGELFKRLVVSANRLSSYVNNILNASRYDRRHLKVHLRENNLSDIYDTISDDMNLRASSQNRLLAVHFPKDLPTIAADKASISEVISNLIDNAVKYSNEGGAVNVTAVVDGDFVKVSVEDHGIGMPGSVISNLFHKFYRSHRSRETVAGTGIGLYICKAIVESHGGKIEVRSTEGEGSVFEFTIPIYSTVADKLTANNNSNEGLIEHSESGWIKNHAMYRG